MYQRLLFAKHYNNLMRLLCDILTFDVCSYLTFVVDVEIDVVTFFVER